MGCDKTQIHKPQYIRYIQAIIVKWGVETTNKNTKWGINTSIKCIFVVYNEQIIKWIYLLNYRTSAC